MNSHINYSCHKEFHFQELPTEGSILHTLKIILLEQSININPYYGLAVCGLPKKPSDLYFACLNLLFSLSSTLNAFCYSQCSINEF